MEPNITSTSSQSITVKSKKNYFNVLFAVIWLCFFVLVAQKIHLNFIQFHIKSSFFDALYYLMSFYIVYQLTWIITGEKTFTVTNHQLAVKTRLLFIKTTRSYAINLIRNLKIEHDVKSGSYSAFMGFRFYGYTDALSFDYNDKKIILGQDLEKFDMEQLKGLIK